LFLAQLKLKTNRNLVRCWWLTPVNPSYLGGSDQEDLGLKPAGANSSWESILKNPLWKKGGGVAKWEEHLLSKQESPSSNSSAAN
jgi:hypothetical protein